MSDAGRDDKEEQEEQEEKALVLTVRLIRSFEHRNVRHLVVRCARGTDSVGRLMDLVRERARDDGRLPPPFRDFPYDTFKVTTTCKQLDQKKSGKLIVDFHHPPPLSHRSSTRLTDPRRPTRSSTATGATATATARPASSATRPSPSRRSGWRTRPSSHSSGWRTTSGTGRTPRTCGDGSHDDSPPFPKFGMRKKMWGFFCVCLTFASVICNNPGCA